MHEVESMFYVDQVPWHGLGVELDNPPTIREAIVAAGLDWTVSTTPLFYRTTDNNSSIVQLKEFKRVPRCAVIRNTDDRCLGVVGRSWTPLQNVDAFEFFQPFLDAELVTLETAGALRHGRHVWVLARLDGDPISVVKDDVIQRFLLLANGHDGTMAATAALTPIRAVCANTLAMALESDQTKMLRVIHTEKVKENLELVRETVDIANNQFAADAELYRDLANKAINPDDLELYIKKVFIGPKKLRALNRQLNSNIGKRILDNVVPLFEKGRGNDLPAVRGTWWAAYNSVTEYLAHERGTSQDRRIDSLWFGAGSITSRKALKLAKDMAFA